MTSNALLASAVWYAQHGLFVFPCQPHAKTPLTPHGFQDATTDLDTIRRWWAETPMANVAIATGQSSLVVIDVDVKGTMKGDDSWADFRQELGEDIEDTPISETPSGGLHICYKAVDATEIRNSASKLAPGIDVRAIGGYIVAPPSILSNGTYQWALGHSPRDGEFAALPQRFGELLANGNGNGEHEPPPRVGDLIKHGTQHHVLVSLAGTMRRRGMDAAAIEAALWQVNVDKCEVPAPRENIQRIAENICELYQPEAPSTNWTDSGNARRLVQRYRDIIRYCHTSGKWLIWDGRRWAQDETGEIVRMAQETIQAMYADAEGLSEDERDALYRYLQRCESEARLKAMISLAQSESVVAITHARLDANPWLLNCQNGVVDLRTGVLGAHDPDLLLTKLAPVDYVPDARSPLWERFLNESTGSDLELIAFLQRCVGYTLSGDTREEKLFFVHGPTNSGKSTFLEAVKAAMADYAATADFETFLQRSFTGSPRPDIARLAGARFVASIEVDEGKRLAEGLVKQLTGGDTITARFLYKEEFEFAPQFKLWLAANHAPEVNHDDAAMWRRILRLPFDLSVPKEQRDATLKPRLRDGPEHQRAVLAWAVRGCLDWQARGLAVPERVQLATEEYRLNQDPLRDFVRSSCVLSPDAWAAARDVRNAYEAYCREDGGKPILGSQWNDALRTLGCEPRRRRVAGKGTRGWQGIGLLGEESENAGAVQEHVQGLGDAPIPF